jgi:hypothetical protein
LVETLSLEWNQKPIDINIVSPGSFKVPRTELANGKCLSGADFDRLFELVSFLLSDDSDGFSGKWVSAQNDDLATMRKRKLMNESVSGLWVLRNTGSGEPDFVPETISKKIKYKAASLLRRLARS